MTVPIENNSYDGQATFLQFKRTDICLDFICPDCGQQLHIDGYFCHAIRCVCGVLWNLASHLDVTRAIIAPTWGIYAPTGEEYEGEPEMALGDAR